MKSHFTCCRALAVLSVAPGISSAGAKTPVTVDRSGIYNPIVPTNASFACALQNGGPGEVVRN